MLTATLANIRARLADQLPSFTPEALYLVGSADAVTELARRRRERGEGSHADRLLEAVALAFELRHDEARREDGDAELQAALARVSDVVEVWRAAVREPA